MRQAQREDRGKLKIFLGAAPGVGKTFEMLREGAERLRAGVDVVIGVVETHGRAETEALLAPFEIISRMPVAHATGTLMEMDLDAILARAPRLVLVDEYAHSNPEECRHPKRWQDVDELLAAGIDVYTTLNVQHIESLGDVVASFTRVRVRETVPDSAIDQAEIEIVDLPPDELIERLKEGKVYVPDEATRALTHFFSKSNLSALRELALRRAALSIDHQMLEHLDANAVPGTFAAGERVLVAVSELPGSDMIVRTAKRLADALHAPWTAVFIETPRAETFSKADRARLADALRLAGTLGATIATVPAENVTAGLLAQIQGMRATQLVMGKSVRSWWFELRHGSVVDRLLKHSEGLAVHVIPATGTRDAQTSRRSAPASRWGSPLVWGLVSLMIALTTGFAELVEPVIGGGGIDLIYLVPTIAAGTLYGLRVGLITGAICALAYNFFFLPPLYTFTIGDPQSVFTVVVLLAVATFASKLAGQLRSRAALGVRSARENAAVAGFAQTLARVSDAESTADAICEEVARLLDVNAIILARNPEGGAPRILAAHPPVERLDPVDIAAVDWAFARGEAAGHGSSTLNAADWQFHPLKTSLGVLAVLGVAREDGADPVPSDRALLLATLVGQAALAHERIALESEMRDLSMLKERDRLRTALLSSIGHDLRTPLTVIAAAVEALKAEIPRSETLPILKSETQRLRRFLDDLLDMARIDAGALHLAPEATDLTDAVASAVHDLRGTLDSDAVDLAVPPTLPLVNADPRLLHHILVNLLANAAQHGGGAIRIEAARRQGGLTLSVLDRGPGLADDRIATIFDTFQRGDGQDRTGGSGLGLAIVKGFADAMHVRVYATNREGGGAAFTLDFDEAHVVKAGAPGEAEADQA
ncbi:MAG: histidine kinase [Sphingomonas sanxanigenens]|uniref:histidine kinase n=1 Tax=Sphingomonas sanxanigenens TaxID=397260 RepID=A0A2W5C5F2_9SPHN|nr:MAG: histidine kinase [Sphingomonas sanxanigenens]